jgi:Spy/CpxP family protein refolding chaperone
MKRLMILTAIAAAALVSQAQAGIPGLKGSGKNNTNQNGEQPGPFGLPGIKKLTEVLTLNHDQEQAVLALYNTYRKEEHKLQQAAQQEKNNKNGTNTNAGAPTKDANTLKSELVVEIKKVLTEDQKKKLDELVADSGKKKKKT